MAARASAENIRVSCRFRPFNAAERNSSPCVDFEGTKHVICRTAQTSCGVGVGNQQQIPSPRGALADETGSLGTTVDPPDRHRYSFACVYAPEATQEELYNGVAAPIVGDVMSGYNGTVLVYGQTGSGKTHTMFGPSSTSNTINTSDNGSFRMIGDPPVPDLLNNNNGNGLHAGIIPRGVQHLFQSIRSADAGVVFEIRLMCAEIYMEQVRDLLTGEVRHIREDSTGFYIANCAQPYITHPDEAMQLLQAALRRRVMSSTAHNDMSSRSHCVVSITVRSTSDTQQETRVGKLFLVDLAGSERVSRTQANGLQLEEAKRINKSLTTLRHVIVSLAKRQPYVPYRDSKLTRILKNSLGGNSRTALIVCCSLSQSYAQETYSSLRFGASAQNVCNRAVVIREHTMQELKSMLENSKLEIERLRRLVKDQNLVNTKSGGMLPLSASRSLTPVLCPQVSSQEQDDIESRSLWGSVSRDDNVEVPPRQGAGRQLSLNDIRTEVERLRDALRDAECREDTLRAQFTTQTSLVQILQEESKAWEEEFTRVVREMYAQRRIGDYYRGLLQDAGAETRLLPQQYSEPTLPCRPAGVNSCEMTLPLSTMANNSGAVASDRHVQSAEGKTTMRATRTGASVESLTEASFIPTLVNQLEVCATSPPQEVRTCNGISVGHQDPRQCGSPGPMNGINADYDEQGYELLLNRLNVAMDEVGQLRNANVSVTLELQLAEKKLTIRHERIESLKSALRQECAARQELQKTLENERMSHRSQLVEAHNSVLYWRQRYEDLLNNSHTSSRRQSIQRGMRHVDNTPALEMLLSPRSRRPLALSPSPVVPNTARWPISPNHDILVKSIRGGGQKEGKE